MQYQRFFVRNFQRNLKWNHMYLCYLPITFATLEIGYTPETQIWHHHIICIFECVFYLILIFLFLKFEFVFWIFFPHWIWFFFNDFNEILFIIYLFYIDLDFNLLFSCCIYSIILMREAFYALLLLLLLLLLMKNAAITLR